jgi:Mn2+/Fe2+ NRAMP family transporter
MVMDFLPAATDMATTMLVIVIMGITIMPTSNVQHQVYVLPRLVIVATKAQVCPSAAGAMVAVVATTIQT